MSATLTLDDSRASWLAGIDPALALLPRALPPAADRASWRLHDVRWDPGRGCRLAYHVQPSGAAPRFVALDVSGTDWRQQDYRQDPSLPGLGSAADPSWVAERLAPVFVEPIEHCRVEPVRYRPGSHCVMRYVVGTASGSTTYYGKVFGDQFSSVVHLATALGRNSEGARLVPRIKAAWPDARTTVGVGVPGRTVSAALVDRSVPAAERVRLAHRLGDLLAAFHAIRDIDAPTWTAADQLAALAGSLDTVRSADPTLGERLSAVLDVLADQRPEPAVPVLGHGGFRAGQVILSGDDLVVLDTDGLCRCDPGRDLGTVLAHLRWQAVHRPDHRPVLHGAERALLSGYEARAGRVDPDSLSWWCAVGLLQVAVRRYRRLEVTDWPAVPALVDAAADLLATRRSRTSPGGGTNLVDPRQMTTLLRLGLPGASSPRTLEVQSAEQVSSVPGRRAVVRYVVRGLTGPEPVTVVGKTFTDAWRARLLHEHLRLLHDGPFGHDGLRVPEPLGLLPEQRLVLYRHCAGTPLDRVSDLGRATEGVRRAARWLARLHTSRLSLPRRYSQDSEEESTRQWAAAISRLHPHLEESARRLAGGWAAGARTASAADEVPIHKDFHSGHVLIGEETCVVDLDEARQGDPAFDVAHFCAYLDLVPQGPDRTHLSGVFRDEYSVRTGWRDGGCYQPFLAYACLKIAKQWAVGSGPARDASPAQRAAGAEAALRKGQECLNG